MSKLNTSKWDDHTEIKSELINFRNDDKSFLFQKLALECENTFLHAVPTECPENMFAMRVNSYIWECTYCQNGKYKQTRGTSHSECEICNSKECSEFKTCEADDKIFFQPSQKDFTQFYIKN